MTHAADANSLPPDLNHELTKGFTARYIRRKARLMLGQAGLRDRDLPDIEQSLLTEVWSAIPTFDAAAGSWRAFVATVVERQAFTYLVRRRTEKRQLGVAVASLDVLVTDADGVQVPLASQIRPEHQSAVTGYDALSELQRAELRVDLEARLAVLPEEERILLLELAECSQWSAARKRGVSRRTLRDYLQRARERIKSAAPASENDQKLTARSTANREA